MLVDKKYVPILKVKISEVEAFRQLSLGCKDVTFPIFLLSPWPNANSLKLSTDKILDATGGRNFGLGLDYNRLGHFSKKKAQEEFDKLFDPNEGFKHYYDLIASLDGAIPVFRPTSDDKNVLKQIENAEYLDRGIIVHQKRDASLLVVDSILSFPNFPQDVLFVIDAEWSRDVLQMQSWAAAIARKIYNTNVEAEMAIVSSSFPDSFAHIIGDSEEIAHEIQVFSVIRATLQGADLTYGDWGSTRLPQSGGGGDIPSRIDVPKPASWQIFRADPKADLGFAAIAAEAMSHPAYSQLPDCWGKLQIAATDGAQFGITGTKMNTSARINMHMTIQAGAASGLDFDDEPYKD